MQKVGQLLHYSKSWDKNDRATINEVFFLFFVLNKSADKRPLKGERVAKFNNGLFGVNISISSF